MNIYYKKQISCVTCGKFIGEVDNEAKVLLPRCGRCAISDADGNDLLTFMSARFENTVKNILVHS